MIVWTVICVVNLLSVTYSKLLVPSMPPHHKYVQPGDISIGVLQNFYSVGPGGQGCSKDTFNTYALHQCESSLYALQEINPRQDILPNISLGIVCMDTCSNSITALGQSVYLVEDHSECPSNATSLTDQELGHHKVVGVIGSGLSQHATVISSLFETFQIPILGTYESSDDLSDKSKYRYFLRLVPPDRFQAQLFIDIILHFNWSYIGLVYSEGAYGEYGAKKVENLVSEYGLCLAYSHKINMQETKGEADAIVDLFNRYDRATVVIWFVISDVSDRILSKLEKQMVSTNHMLLVTDSTAMVAGDHARILNGALAVSFVTPPVPGYREYFTAVASLNATNPNFDDTWSKYWFQKAWEITYNCDWSLTGNNSCSHFEAVASWKYATYASTNYYEAAYVYANALHNLISSECPAAFEDPSLLEECIKGPDLLKTMKELEIPSLTGLIAFDENGDRLPQYLIFQLYLDKHDQQARQDIGTWDKYTGKLTIQANMIRWSHLDAGQDGMTMAKSNSSVTVPESLCSYECEPKQYKIQMTPHCCWDCRWCRNNERLIYNKTSCETCPKFTWPDDATATICLAITPSYTKWTDTMAICLVVFALIGTTITICFIVITWQHRNTRLIKATNKELSFLMLISATLAFLNSLFFIGKPSNVVCLLRLLGFHFVVNILYAPLLVKTVRVHIIFTTGKKGIKAPAFVSLRAQRAFVLALVLSQIAILLGMNIYSPSVTTLLMPVSTEPYVELACSREMIPFLLPLIYNVVSIFLCAIFGYSARKLPDNYNESGFIFVSVATTLFAWVVLLPTFFTAGSADHQAAILALCLMLNAYITVGCLFAPKIYALFCVDESTIKFSTMSNSTSVTVTS